MFFAAMGSRSSKWLCLSYEIARLHGRRRITGARPFAEAFGKEERDAKITEAQVTADRPDDRGIFSLRRPEGGWPVGRYRLEIYVGDQLAAAVKFKIEEDVTVQVE